MKIAVVGAGIAGLTAAFRLQQAGHDVEVLERAEHPGGRMWSVRAGGFEVDVGAHMLLGSFARTRALVDEMGLGDQWFEIEGGEGGGVLHHHELTSFSPNGAFDVLRYRGLSLGGRIRLALTLFEARRWLGQLDFFDLSIGDDTLDTEDCDTFARRRLGDEATDYILDCFIRTFHFHGAHRMSAKYFEALSALLLSHGEFRPCALRGYMKALPEALAARLPVRYLTAVHSVIRDAGRVEIRWANGAARYDAAVVATPADTVLPLLQSASPAERSLLANAVSSCTALCVYTLPVELAGNFEGVWVPFRESQIVSGLSNDTSKGSTDGKRCVFNVWLHEEAAAPLLKGADQELERVVAGEVERLFPRYAGHFSPIFVQRWAHALPVYGVGQVTRVREFWENGQGCGGVWLCGDYLNHPWVEGAVRCGEKVAARLSG
jgi:oxygen-dependent protoporphyrinogen oxidase